MKSVLLRGWFAALVLTVAVHATAAPVKFLRSPHVNRDSIAFMYHGDIWIANRDGSDPRRLTNHVASDSTPRFSPDGQWVAFNSNRMGNSDVWIIPIGGGAARQLTFHGTTDRLQYWTPEGDGVIITTSRGSGAWGGPMQIVPLDGSLPVPMRMDVASAGMINLDGSKVAFNRNGYRGRRKHYRGNNSTDIWVQDLRTLEIAQLTDLDLRESREHVQDSDPMWGRDGKIYFTSERDGYFNLWRIRSDGQGLEQVTHHEQDGVVNPSVSPDGTTIIYENEFELWTLDLPDGQPRKIGIDLEFDDKHNLFEVLTSEDEVDGFSPHPDGSSVAVDYHGEIFVVPSEADIGEKTRVTSSAWRERSESWSPDGKYLAYVSDESLEEEIWLYELETATRQKLTDLPAIKANLTWSPNSARLAFVADNTLYSIDIASSTTTALASNPEGGYRLSDISKDGRYLVYSRSDEDLNSDVYILDTQENQESNLTQNPFRDSGGVLTSDGKQVVFHSNRDDGNTHLFRVPLSKVAEDPDDPLVRQRLQQAEKKKGKGGKRRGKGRSGKDQDESPAEPEEPQEPQETEEAEATADEPESSEAAEEPAAVALDIDLDGIDRRAVQLTSGESNESSYFLSEDGETVYFVSSPISGGSARGSRRRGRGEGDSGSALHSIGLDGKDQKKVADGSFRGLTPTADRKSAFYSDDDKLHRLTLSGKQQEQIKFALQVRIDKRGEWEQIFEESWRVMKYRFYDENMHGFDWDRIKAQYKPTLAYVGADEDVYDLANEMIGELNASHVGVSGQPSQPQPEAYQTALLGFELEPGEQHYQITHIYRDGPADKEWLDLGVGDHVLAIDGQELAVGDNYWKILNNLLNDYATVKVWRPGSDAAEFRLLRIKTTTSLRNVKYEEWVEDNRDWVEQYSGNRIAYLHIRSMNQSSLRRFENEIDRFWNAKGIVIDIRNNGGGNIDQELLDILERRPYEYWNSRRGSRAAGRRPQQAIAGPKVMLINHRSGSDSEVTPQGFRDLGLGRIVGNPTAAAVIATGSYRLINGASIRTPGALVATYDPTRPNNYGINLENYGVPPDVWVENTPQDVLNGFDRELQAAVDEALRMLEIGLWQYDPERAVQPEGPGGK